LVSFEAENIHRWRIPILSGEDLQQVEHLGWVSSSSSLLL